MLIVSVWENALGGRPAASGCTLVNATLANATLGNTTGAAGSTVDEATLSAQEGVFWVRGWPLGPSGILTNST